MRDDEAPALYDSVFGFGERPAHSLKILLATPRGFCAGVRRAIDAVVDAIELHGAPVYVRRAIVHNLAVVRSLEAQGAIFVEELAEVPKGAVVVLSAHGVARGIRSEAKNRDLIVYDAVCPLVTKVHREVVRHYRAGRHVILVGHAGHPEIIGTLGQIPDDAASLVRSRQDVDALSIPTSTPIGFAVQTTYSVEEAADVVAAIESRFALAFGPSGSDICYATTNRQSAVRELAAAADAIIVAGENFSSNARRLTEVAAAAGCMSVQLVAQAQTLKWSKIPAGGTVGITAAASTPETTVTDIIDALRSRFDVQIEVLPGIEESTAFRPVAIG